MKKYPTNEERTTEYLKNFDRKKVLKYLVQRNDPLIFDIGANIGSTLREFKSWWKESTIHCFEPQEECWDQLEKAKADYSDGKIFINKLAAGNFSNQELTFYSHDVDSTKGTSGFNKVNLESLDSLQLNQLKALTARDLDDYKKTLNHERIVEVRRMDDYVSSLGLKQLDLLKIDTQGYEPEVLEGFGRSLASVNVVITELMFYDYYERSLSFSDIENFLHPAGLYLYDINHIAKNPMNGRTDWVDVIYVHDRVREKIKCLRRN